MPTGEQQTADAEQPDAEHRDTHRRDVERPDADRLDVQHLASVLPFPSIARRNAPTPVTPGLRVLIGDVLRDERHRQERTLADVAEAAAVSLPYLSEVERGRKEISSDLLDAVSAALDLTLIDVLERSTDRLRARVQGTSGIQLRAA